MGVRARRERAGKTTPFASWLAGAELRADEIDPEGVRRPGW
jgi:hypothetical protein